MAVSGGRMDSFFASHYLYLCVKDKINMKLFDNYLSKQTIPNQATELKFKTVDLILVIPCINELKIYLTIQSLFQCALPPVNIEIIVVINAPDNCANNIIEVNKSIRSQICELSKKSPTSIYLRSIYLDSIPTKTAGAGFARKVGMDEAIRVFNVVQNPSGIILSLDADCLVENNYFVSIYNHFQYNKKMNTAIIHFEHIMPRDEFDQQIYKAGILYELYLRYYKEALNFIDYPYPYHTIGSAFAIKAEAYVKIGGMNKKQAGEDFYFLQKAFTLDGITEINDTSVYPEIRVSDRVVFGTGPAIKKILSTGEMSWKTYPLESFLILKTFFSYIDFYYCETAEKIEKLITCFPESLTVFLLKNDFLEKLSEIKQNTSSLKNFKKRFFSWFNAFMIIKYMHDSHPAYYDLQEVNISAEELLEKITRKKYKNLSIEELVCEYRSLQIGMKE